MLSPSLSPQSWYGLFLQIASIDENIVESDDYNTSDVLTGTEIAIISSFLLADILESIKEMRQVVVKWQDPILSTLWPCLQKHRRFFFKEIIDRTLEQFIIVAPFVAFDPYCSQMNR